MENPPDQEVIVPKTNILFEVTPVSKILAAVLFIILPFVGGWIGYTYGNINSSHEVSANITLDVPNQILVPELDTETKTNPETNKMNWTTARASADGKEITIHYPAEIPVNVAALSEAHLGIDPGVPNYTLPLTANKEIIKAELTTDLKYLFFLKRDSAPDVVTLYKGTVSSQMIEKITDYNLSALKEILDSDLSILMPLVTVDDFIIYNVQPDATSNEVVGRVITTENNVTLYEAPCAYDRFSGNSHTSPDKLLIVWNCREDGVYISDWKNNQKILNYSDTMKPTAVSFMNNERIEFANIAEANDMLRAPNRSIKIDGTDARLEEGDVYLGY